MIQLQYLRQVILFLYNLGIQWEHWFANGDICFCLMSTAH